MVGKLIFSAECNFKNFSLHNLVYLICTLYLNVVLNLHLPQDTRVAALMGE